MSVRGVIHSVYLYLWHSKILAWKVLNFDFEVGRRGLKKRKFRTEKWCCWFQRCGFCNSLWSISTVFEGSKTPSLSLCDMTWHSTILKAAQASHLEETKRLYELQVERRLKRWRIFEPKPASQNTKIRLRWKTKLNDSTWGKGPPHTAATMDTCKRKLLRSY